MNPKPSWQSMEFWTTVAMQLFAILVTIGVLTLSQAQTWEGITKDAIAVIFAIIAAAWKSSSFDRTRQAVKVEAEVTKQEAIKAVAELME